MRPSMCTSLPTGFSLLNNRRITRAVHDDHRRRRGVVARLEPSAGHQPNAHRLQVVVADGANVRIVRVVAHLVRRAPRRDEGADPIDDPKQRTGIGVARAAHLGQAAQLGRAGLSMSAALRAVG